MQQHRKIKLQSYHSERAGRNARIVPELRLRGCWLEELGFNPGDTLEITSRDKLLIIQPVRDPQDHSSREKLARVKRHLKSLL